jgi:hypothetical protein
MLAWLLVAFMLACMLVTFMLAWLLVALMLAWFLVALMTLVLGSAHVGLVILEARGINIVAPCARVAGQICDN